MSGMVPISGAAPPREEGGSSSAQIARIAARLFAARGYDATPVREIVEAAGVTKPTLYYHFKSKEGLAQALLTDPLDALLGAMRRALDAEPDPRRALETLIELNLAFSRDEPDRARFLYALFFGPLGSGLAEEVHRFGDALDRLWAELADRLVRANILDPDRVGRFLAMLRGAIVATTVDYLYCGQAIGPERPGQIASDLLQGFGLRPGRGA